MDHHVKFELKKFLQLHNQSKDVLLTDGQGAICVEICDFFFYIKYNVYEKCNVAYACFGTVPISAGVDCPYSRRAAVLKQEKCKIPDET